MCMSSDTPSPWLAPAIGLVLFIPLHELAHLLFQPGWGLTDRSVVVAWPIRLQFGVYYEGCMSMRRWLAIRLAPLVLLTLLPAALIALAQLLPPSPDLEIGLIVLMLVNSLGSGADLVTGAYVMRQVPSTADICFHQGWAYWRPAQHLAETDPAGGASGDA